ncbi:MAG: putative chemotaxis phosphatase, CheX [Sporomusa sp.]|jgi:chemotaxis protein CheX|nr:putative chemotaxis phosphatase, CheX [Sporomusa sp.]
MDVQLVNPFLAALLTILPQLGFKNVARGKVFTKDQYIDALGVTVNITLTNQISGNVVFNMTEETAKGLSSTIMMGAAVTSLDDIAKSAICEMGNMIASSAVNNLSKNGIAVKLGPPALAQSNSKIKICDSNFIGIEMIADELKFEMQIGVN